MGKYVNGEIQTQRDVTLHSVDKIDIYEVQKSDIDSLLDTKEKDAYLSAASSFASASLTFIVTVISCDLTEIANVSFKILACLSVLLTIFFGVIWYYKHKKSKAAYDSIINRHAKTKRISPK